MINELIDIVDENNNLIGESRPRSVVHQTGLWHRVVHVYIFRRNGDKFEILVHLRAKNKDLHPNKWTQDLADMLNPGSLSRVLSEMK